MAKGERAYHFLPEQWALEALFKRRLKISILNDLNDPFELSNFENANQNEGLAWKQMIEEISNKFGVMCFSKGWQNPLLWSHYADKHKGICLGFEISGDLKEIIYRDSPIPYNEVKVLFDSRLYQKNPDNKAQNEKMMEVYRTKYVGWKYEDEARVFTSLQEKVA
ncbi:MAG: DUF2971 domain-containing protein [Nitrospinae bacterium]|nr:DUF2971 domain-containing protein [Nitrospinota bacterium]